MNNTMSELNSYLTAAGYSVGSLERTDSAVLTFENDTVLGFVLHYPTAAELLDDWNDAMTEILDSAQFVLRQAGRKAWNTYLLLLADESGDYAQNVALVNVEEDLVGTRKIARAGVVASNELRNALLPLLDIQNAPHLERVEMTEEIRLRTSELSEQLVEAFLSEATESVLIQLLEDTE